ncbi:DUF6922 domain-containing protein [Desulfotomaculum copahuensis]|uniref:DUF6922 domain-containing protein n=1 Tax=Desulfotomaculum copahuensis TaxID=1838280 RepID=A0A1B7LJM5_9FIRM|nr:hypothetical protein A6M21_02280 [Desulfotomaculum copahuensis]
MILPSLLAPLFRNYLFDTIDPERDFKFIIKTTLSTGSWEQILWLFEHYGEKRVRETFLEDYYGLRSLPENARKLWELVFVEKPAVEKTALPGDKWRCRRMAGG